MDPRILNLNFPQPNSHKGQNGRLMIIGGSRLFHAASLWSLQVASRIVDLVHYASIPENNRLVHDLKKEFRDGIVIPRIEIENYIAEDDVILIGPGLLRAGNLSNMSQSADSMAEIEKIEDEGLQTYNLTNYLLHKYPRKQWVIDAGALQMVDLAKLPSGAIITPHSREFAGLLERDGSAADADIKKTAVSFAGKYKIVLILKGQIDLVVDGASGEVREVSGGNAGMTKGGTGDVLAGLVSALACKNPPFIAAWAASIINKSAGDELFKSVGPFFNASDLAAMIPKVMGRMFFGNA